jgi:hypothetical protein
MTKRNSWIQRKKVMFTALPYIRMALPRHSRSYRAIVDEAITIGGGGKIKTKRTYHIGVFLHLKHRSKIVCADCELKALAEGRDEVT